MPSLLLLLVVCFAAAPPALADAGATSTVDKVTVSRPADPTRSLLALINAYRADAGLTALAPASSLQAIAQAHSDAMVAQSFFAHCDPAGRCLRERLQAAGYRARVWAENIAAGQRSAEAVLRSWQDSPPHNANLLNPRVSEIGLGYAPGRLLDYRGAWTLVVAAPWGDD